MVEKLGTAAMLELAVLSMKDSLFDLVSIHDQEGTKDEINELADNPPVSNTSLQGIVKFIKT